MNSKQKKILKQLSIFLLYMIITLAISYKLTLLIETSVYSPEELVGINSSLGKNYLFYIFPGMAFIYLILAITGRFISSLLIGGSALFLLGYVNKTYVTERNEIISFSQITELKNISLLIQYLDIKLLIGFVLAIILAIIIFRKDFKFSYHYRVVSLIIAVVFFQMFNLKAYPLERVGWVHNPLKNIKSTGVIVNLLNTNMEVQEKVENYSKKNTKEIVSKYSVDAYNRDKEPHEKDNTVIILSESLIETTPFDKEDKLLPTIHSLAGLNGGKMRSTSIGGGTANIEFSVRTGISLDLLVDNTITPYHDFYVKKGLKNITADTNYTTKKIIHPYTLNLYNRKTVYENYQQTLNEDFVKIEPLRSNQPDYMLRISDEKFYNEIISELQETKEPQSIVSLSMQNHSPYSYKDSMNLTIDPIKVDVDEGIQKQFNLYQQLISDTDVATKKFIDKVSEMDTKVNTNILFFGDHGPSFSDKILTGDQSYETPYFIFSNGKKVNDSVLNTSPDFLFTKLLVSLNKKITPYQLLQKKLMEANISSINSHSVFKEGISTPIDNLSKKEQELVNDYIVINYDMVTGEQYSKGMFKLE
ncbi:LTA synthase family protein [Vagococcus intermedius]|uniref:LTA synthase family protein n=1 Tax=Vagococcus intermedius TaxID=2991418 RepID=A0AAF0I6A8_9ENTE|nr:LTA synthase family protein [Vagococcus intermedius]WEG72570.1 LTA synthase family protein [Vagococcus intermedius]WEG74656.1 LTA synthase family protein [Vagococcus intermedius]